MKNVLSAYNLAGEVVNVQPFGSGLINRTWKVGTATAAYVLQQVNNKVFPQPMDIADNLRLLAAYLKQKAPDYLFVAPLPAASGADLLFVEGTGFFRLFPFVNGSHSKTVVETPEQAFEAAAQFGRFTRLLDGFDASRLKITLPDFHNLALRYRQFEEAIKTAGPQRKRAAKDLIAELQSRSGLVAVYKSLKANPQFRLRVTHHDAKISNVLFNDKDRGLCLVDFDTVMPGYFTSDVGDMMRTYLSPVSEEEQDLNKIVVRDDFYKAIVSGYAGEMKEALTGSEKDSFFFAGQFIIYMQALRFLTDYLNNDAYYGAAYPEQNLVRARNQTVLLQRLTEKKTQLTMR